MNFSSLSNDNTINDLFSLLLKQQPQLQSPQSLKTNANDISDLITSLMPLFQKKNISSDSFDDFKPLFTKLAKLFIKEIFKLEPEVKGIVKNIISEIESEIESEKLTSNNIAQDDIQVFKMYVVDCKSNSIPPSLRKCFSRCMGNPKKYPEVLTHEWYAMTQTLLYVAKQENDIEAINLLIAKTGK